MTLHQLAGTPDDVADRRRAQPAMRGGRRALGADLPAEAEQHARPSCVRSSPRSRTSPPAEQRHRLADEGYITPAWPRPWGRDAAALELLVIEEEFRAAKVVRPGHHGRRVGAAEPHRATARASNRSAGSCRRCGARSSWCQLFSEPGAGSDLASLSTKATRGRGRLGAERPEGLDVDGEGSRLGHLPRAHRSRQAASTTASRAS